MEDQQRVVSSVISSVISSTKKFDYNGTSETVTAK